MRSRWNAAGHSDVRDILWCRCLGIHHDGADFGGIGFRARLIGRGGSRRLLAVGLLHLLEAGRGGSRDHRLERGLHRTDQDLPPVLRLGRRCGRSTAGLGSLCFLIFCGTEEQQINLY